MSSKGGKHVCARGGKKSHVALKVLLEKEGVVDLHQNFKKGRMLVDHEPSSYD